MIQFWRDLRRLLFQPPAQSMVYFTVRSSFTARSQKPPSAETPQLLLAACLSASLFTQQQFFSLTSRTQPLCFYSDPRPVFPYRPPLWEGCCHLPTATWSVEMMAVGPLHLSPLQMSKPCSCSLSWYISSSTDHCGGPAGLASVCNPHPMVAQSWVQYCRWGLERAS